MGRQIQKLNTISIVGGEKMNFEKCFSFDGDNLPNSALYYTAHKSKLSNDVSFSKKNNYLSNFKLKLLFLLNLLQSRKCIKSSIFNLVSARQCTQSSTAGLAAFKSMFIFVNSAKFKCPF